MKRKTVFIYVLSLFLILCVASPAWAVSIQTVSALSSDDSAIDAYLAIIAEWETETGNTVEDLSSASDEAWKTGVLNDFATGNEPDILFFFANTSDSLPILDRVVPIADINAAYPDLFLTESDLLREADGKVYAIPVRPFWEALFCNLDLFEQVGAELPTDWEKFQQAVEKFKAAGIVPLAASLSDVPHYVAEIPMLASGPPAEHLRRPACANEIPASFIEGMQVIRELYLMGAFPANVNSSTATVANNLFIGKQAAMLLEGSWFANGIAEAHWDTTVVLPFPAIAADADPTVSLGGVSMGFYLTRKAWNDPIKRDAAVSFLAKVTSEDSVRRLGYTFGGKLQESAEPLLLNIVPPFQDDMDPEVRSYWFSQIPAIADGTADPAQVMAEVFSRNPFQLDD